MGLGCSLWGNWWPFVPGWRPTFGSGKPTFVMSSISCALFLMHANGTTEGNLQLIWRVVLNNTKQNFSLLISIPGFFQNRVRFFFVFFFQFIVIPQQTVARLCNMARMSQQIKIKKKKTTNILSLNEISNWLSTCGFGLRWICKPHRMFTWKSTKSICLLCAGWIEIGNVILVHSCQKARSWG